MVGVHGGSLQFVTFHGWLQGPVCFLLSRGLSCAGLEAPEIIGSALSFSHGPLKTHSHRQPMQAHTQIHPCACMCLDTPTHAHQEMHTLTGTHSTHSHTYLHTRVHSELIPVPTPTVFSSTCPAHTYTLIAHHMLAHLDTSICVLSLSRTYSCSLPAVLSSCQLCAPHKAPKSYCRWQKFVLPIPVLTVQHGCRAPAHSPDTSWLGTQGDLPGHLHFIQVARALPRMRAS